MAGEPFAMGEAVLEDLRELATGVGERHEAVADVARGQHSQLAPEVARGAAVVGHGDNRRSLEAAAQQAREHEGQPGAATHCNCGTRAHRRARSFAMSRWLTDAG